MLSTAEILSKASEFGFSHVGELNVDALEFLPAVRDMCAADRCHMYNRSWSCPPGCGTLDEMRTRASAYRRGVLFQTTGALEDDFDAETMMEAAALQQERALGFIEWLRTIYPDCMPMCAGACQICETCTYPDAPCRFPQRAIPSMEACGLMVSQVCEASGLPYYYGPQTITYTGCALID